MPRALIFAPQRRSIVSSIERLWKRELQALADELKIEITVNHLPPGTSKWNKIGVSRTHPQGKEEWSCTRDGGRPGVAQPPRGRQSGADLKPLQAAVVKSDGGERCSKRRD